MSQSCHTKRCSMNELKRRHTGYIHLYTKVKSKKAKHAFIHETGQGMIPSLATTNFFSLHPHPHLHPTVSCHLSTTYPSSSVRQYHACLSCLVLSYLACYIPALLACLHDPDRLSSLSFLSFHICLLTFLISSCRGQVLDPDKQELEELVFVFPHPHPSEIGWAEGSFSAFVIYLGLPLFRF
ncbi:hypothetical protein BDW74DRAFT_9152 [Aspergillus multicolor]|uniref:uncharacterized protein n=1 Tax=Aspergillus multicolor TaxID=41759 RepID=UPI003CCCC286